MITLRSLRRILKPISLIALIGLLLALPARALAHPLDQYLQMAYITVGTTRIEVELDLNPGVLVAPALLPTIDTDADQQISDSEAQTYIDLVLSDISLQLDNQPQSLTITRLETPTYAILQSGYGTYRIFATATVSTTLTGTHHVSFTNTHHPTSAAYQVNAFIEKGASITLGKQNRSDNQQSLNVDYTIASTQTTTATTTTTVVSTPSNQLLDLISNPSQSIWLFLGALALAVALGGLHALTPGHGKALVATYLVGSRGTVKHAVALGGIVTITHTSSVITIGILALVASQFVLPSVLVPTLEILSGLLVLYIGARLVYLRVRAFHSNNPNHDHTHPHDHDHTRDPNNPHTHTHNTQHSALSTQHSDTPTRRDLLTMGISGGIIPCPEALGVMLIAISLNRIALGLGMIVAFSLGLALVLIAIGILFVRARSFATHIGTLGSPIQRYIPLASALIVTLLGLGIVLKGFTSYFG